MLLMGIDDNYPDKKFGTHLVPISFVLQQRADNLNIFVFQAHLTAGGGS